MIDEYNNHPQSIRDEETDGRTVIKLDNEIQIVFLQDTSTMSLRICEGCEIKPSSFSFEKDVSTNEFWNARLNEKITDIFILQSLYASEDYPSEFGIEFKLSNGKNFIVEYIDNEDSMRITDKYKGPKCKFIEAC